MRNRPVCFGEELPRIQWLEACRLNRASPELRRENGLRSDANAGRCVLQPSSCHGKTPGNLRFTTLLGKGKCEVRKSTGAGEGIRTLDPNLGKVVLYP